MDSDTARRLILTRTLEWDTAHPGEHFFDALEPHEDYGILTNEGRHAWVRANPEGALDHGWPAVALSAVADVPYIWAYNALSAALDAYVGRGHYYNLLDTAKGKEKLAALIEKHWDAIWESATSMRIENPKGVDRG